MKPLYLNSLFAILTFACGIRAEIVVNEVLSNEPAGATSLEWIELYNDSDLPVSFEGYSLNSSGSAINLPDSVSLASFEYYIICRRLFQSGGTPGFESYWGDSSGIWGDNAYEAPFQRPFEAVFGLINTSGMVELSLNSTVVSTLSWSETGQDGYSWERTRPDLTTVVQSIDASGSTPGKVNSVTPLPFDLSLDNILVESDRGVCNLTFVVRNIGLNTFTNGRLFVETVGDNPPLVIDELSLPELTPGQTTAVPVQYQFPRYYKKLNARLGNDDRLSNNVKSFTATGELYPPVVLSELMANPQNGLNSEWLELKNNSDTTIDLRFWRYGDAVSVHSIVDSTVLLEPGKYIVLAQSKEEFQDFFPGYILPLLQPSQWSTFNNDADEVRLYDSLDIRADYFVYNSVFDNNYTWSRGEDAAHQYRWGRSENVFGTPGGYNQVVFTSETGSLKVTLDPIYVSPDGDGVDEYTEITIDAPSASDFTVKIYDRQGRVVKSFYESESLIPSRIQWDGLSDAGQRLPIGMYILYVEAGGESVKETIVVAR